MNDKVQKARNDYECGCNQYVACLCELWNMEESQGYWVSDEVGGLYCVGDFVTLDMEDLRYVVEHEIGYDEVCEWIDYNVKALEYNFDTINLKSWHKGAPRIPQSTFNRLDDLRKEFNEAIEKAKKDGKKEETTEKKKAHY